jgi:hypothetical protein
MRRSFYFWFCFVGLFTISPLLAQADNGEPFVRIVINLTELTVAKQDNLMVLTMDSNVQRASYTRYFFSPMDWQIIASQKDIPDRIYLELIANPRPAPAPSTNKTGAQPQGGIRFLDYQAKLVRIIPTLEIFRGIVPSASGPGLELILYLYADGETFMRYSYLKYPDTWFSSFGTWTSMGARLQIRPLQTDGIGLDFIRSGSYLRISDPQGQVIFPDLPRAVLVLSGP